MLENAYVKIVYRDAQKMIFRVYPEVVRLTYVGGQYGALGLPQSNSQETLVKRAYSISSSILNDQDELIDPEQQDYYEFYVDLILADESVKPRLSRRLFDLNDNDRIFMGSKIVGHYTLKNREEGKHCIFIATTTGEAPHNSMVLDFYREKYHDSVVNIVTSDQPWDSAYTAQHQKLMKKFPTYRFIALPPQEFHGTEKKGTLRKSGGGGVATQTATEYARVEGFVAQALTDEKFSLNNLGWVLKPENTHFFLCGDPRLIGAPVKLGAWQVEYPEYGLMRILEKHGFTPATRFQPGNVSHEAYW